MSDRMYAGLLFGSWIIFFVAQVTIKIELPLTILAVIFSVLLLWKRERGEGVLFSIGLGMGLFIEVGLGLVTRTQHWEHASLLGVPAWLPLIWGYGFVIMRRGGNLVVASFGKN